MVGPALCNKYMVGPAPNTSPFSAKKPVYSFHGQPASCQLLLLPAAVENITVHYNSLYLCASPLNRWPRSSGRLPGPC